MKEKIPDFKTIDEIRAIFSSAQGRLEMELKDERNKAYPKIYSFEDLATRFDTMCEERERAGKY